MTSTTNVRIGHCSPDAPAVDIHIDGKPVLHGVDFGTVTEYIEVPSGEHSINVVPAGKPDQSVIEKSLDLTDDHDYTVLAIGSLADIDTLVLNDTNEAVSGDNARIRFVHASPDAPEVDLAFDGDAVFREVPFGRASPYGPVTAGTYDLSIRPAGESESVIDVPGAQLERGSTYTAFAIGTLADDAVDVLVTKDSQPAAKVA
ncbi:DUF4397 domain-containing protein [Haloarchaeobius sp. DFWS5]|uniref:DUF4397 domain-containing protein n=1 Tax=Haloarchaeobius sp. DFWS5 TaxID=3446114 RepID=UPI003EBDBCCE